MYAIHPCTYLLPSLCTLSRGRPCRGSCVLKLHHMSRLAAHFKPGLAVFNTVHGKKRWRFATIKARFCASDPCHCTTQSYGCCIEMSRKLPLVFSRCKMQPFRSHPCHLTIPAACKQPLVVLRPITVPPFSNTVVTVQTTEDQTPRCLSLASVNPRPRVLATCTTDLRRSHAPRLSTTTTMMMCVI